MSIINFEKVLGNHETALKLQSRRASTLSANIANADTPGYKARDLDFKEILKSSTNDLLPMQKTSSSHLSSYGMDASGFQLKYRIPNQASLDGNTVDLDMEKSAYSENALRYQTSLRFITGKFKGMMKAFQDN
jgi:flagellar basal-body rod protein FlgB